MRELTELKFDQPFKIQAGEQWGIYVHSERDDDDGIVYDNTSSRDLDDQLLRHGTLNVEPQGSVGPFVLASFSLR